VREADENVLNAWKLGGLDAVLSMVQKGLAPAAVLSVFAGQQAVSPNDQVM
jgi:hypothetical protein